MPEQIELLPKMNARLFGENCIVESRPDGVTDKEVAEILRAFERFALGKQDLKQKQERGEWYE